MPFLFGLTLFVSATLLFWVQPMVAKMLLPFWGGAPAVWNTCMVFFQAVLLAGYVYAHLLTSRLSARSQTVVHLALLLSAAAFLPVAVSEANLPNLSPESDPSWWLLGCLLAIVGGPFFILSSSGPLFQKWFSNTRHPAAKDPYFLYGVSNLGSLIALLGYAVIIEPNLRLRTQSWVWAGGYAVLILLSLCCTAFLWRWHPLAVPKPGSNGSPEEPAVTGESPAEPLSLRRQIKWTFLAFVPSSLMLGVTNFLTTDIASIPLIWVIPLAIYLLTFILAFSRRRLVSLRWLSRALPIGALGLTFLILSRATQPVWLLMVCHLLVFFLAALLCHGRLAEDRPAPAHLTEFYLWISLGGVLGGLFNALLAPHLFNAVLEYPLALVLACLLRPRDSAGEIAAGRRWLDFALPLLLGTLTVGLALMIPFFEFRSVHLRNAVVIGVPALIGFTFVDRTVRFGLGLGAILLCGGLFLGTSGQTLFRERNFFGVSRVTRDAAGTFRRMFHGNTLHGRQFLASHRQCEPLAYYHRTGPLGGIFEQFNARPAAARVAVIGLGTGSMISYATVGQEWTYYEIDPLVVRIASDTNYFTYLSHCAKAKPKLVLGDARLRLREAPDAFYGLIVLDAFSSDAIPVHLLTAQALELYLSKLAPDGMLAFHISNRYLELEPVVGDLARNAGLVCYGWDDMFDDTRQGKDASHWVVLARKSQNLGGLVKSSRWLPVPGRSEPKVWTDDFSNILSALKWK
ncbi:MAG: fused MFS/spermidine synthase [Verrucomicrobiota bacterium]